MRGAEYADLAAFVAVAHARSFRQASAQLGLSRSALSHTIRKLEERLGASLLNRTTRSVGLTEAGLNLLERLVPAFNDIAAAVEAVSALRQRASGTVRLSVPRAAAHMVLAPAFGRFMRAHPDVRLEVIADDGFIDIVERGFDAGIRTGGQVPRDMVAVRVTADVRVAVVASPAYLVHRPPPATPRDLKQHLCIGYRQIASRALYRWQFQQGGQLVEFAVDGPLTLDDPDLMVAAALDGVGLAYLFEPSVTDYVAAGRLVRVLEDCCPLFPGFFLYYPGRRQVLPALRALADFIRFGGDAACDHSE